MMYLCFGSSLILQEGDFSMTEGLPIKFYKKEILYAIDNHDVVLISAETGSGKTTQIPQFLIQAGYTTLDKKIGVVLPRKIAAISLSKRVSEELGCYNGQIAHKVRFNSGINSNTRVVFMTDGSLVQELYSDPLLQDYSVIVLDDVHERSISYDILFSFLKKIMHQRKGLKLVITSASLENTLLKNFFELNKDYKNEQFEPLKVKTINITGRLHEVFIHYLRTPTKNFFLKTFQTIVYIEREKGQGDVLVFLTSVEEIEGMSHMLDSYMLENKRKFKVLLLHSKLSLEQQNLIFEHTYERKIILSTNIAESSITIPDIKFVVDSGYVKVKIFDSDSGIDKMIVLPCGKSSANQRAGRAGRVTDGECFRVYHQGGYKDMPDKIPAQIMRMDLSNFILKIKGLGITDIVTFQMLERPDEKHLIKAIDILFAYELIDDHFQLTEKGKKVAQLSVDIRNACMLMNSFDPKFACSREILMLVSMLEVQTELFAGQGLGILKAKKKIGSKEGDFLTLINFFIRYQHAKITDRKRLCGEYKLRPIIMDQALKIYDELLGQLKKFNRFKDAAEQMQFKFSGESGKKIYEIRSSADEYESILRCILTGYFTNIAQIQGDGSYLNIRSKQKLKIHSTSILSVVYPEWIVYHQIIKSSGYQIHNGSLIYPDWITELAGNYYTDKRKEIATNSFEKEKEIQRIDVVKMVGEQKGLFEVGSIKKKQQVFNTNVLGLKKMKKSQLSFQQEI